MFQPFVFLVAVSVFKGSKVLNLCSCSAAFISRVNVLRRIGSFAVVTHLPESYRILHLRNLEVIAMRTRGSVSICEAAIIVRPKQYFAKF